MLVEHKKLPEIFSGSFFVYEISHVGKTNFCCPTLFVGAFIIHFIQATEKGQRKKFVSTQKSDGFTYNAFHDFLNEKEKGLCDVRRVLHYHHH